MVRGAGAIQFMDRFDDVVVDLIEVMPIPYRICDGHSADDREMWSASAYAVFGVISGRWQQTSIRRTAPAEPTDIGTPRVIYHGLRASSYVGNPRAQDTHNAASFRTHFADV